MSRKSISRTSVSRARPIRVWLVCVALLTIATVLVGGATRLTQSGLSIVEWRPVTGTLPPLSQSAWEQEFAKYKTIPQYEIVNRGMSLDDFKTIYWWEWGHRNLARAIGVVFLLPFLWFLWRGAIGARLSAALAGVFALGAIQGGVGWWMVSSGLADRVSVSQYRLAFHLTLACTIFAVLVWIAARLGARGAVAVPSRLRIGAVALVVLVTAQIDSGALVAGLHAGLVHTTWPTIDGHLIPPAADLFFAHPAWTNFFENTLTVQFTHRTIAYLVVLTSLLHLVDAMVSAPAGGGVRSGAVAVAAAVLLQATVGVVTLVHQVPIDLALVHQAGAVVVLTVAVLQAERVTRGGRVAVRDPDPVLAVG